jgi:hypothetical protein
MDRSSRLRLLVAGRIAGRPAICIPYPTGAQVAGEDWLRVAAVLAERLGLGSAASNRLMPFAASLT